MNDEINEAVFALLSERINSKQKVLEKSGRKGMGIWEILVLGVMRQGLNANYDRIHYLANVDTSMRTVMGIETESRQNKKQYGLTTIKDNLALLDEQTIEQVNDMVIGYGQKLLKKRRRAALGKS